MMLNMSNKFERYLCGRVPLSSSISGYGDVDLPTTSSVVSATLPPDLKAERESIHSGQFMVSHFEAEEAQDDLDDSEVKMLDPEDPNLLKTDEANTCMQVQLYVPLKHIVQLQNDGGSTSTEIVTSHLEIETSLTKLFKCMNLAYSQKLTSPKWNHFKGVRLRWKDKIRLNNVIWRCWHMQFILKRKTPVCQFASPLDVDIHSNPQSVVLEGKYWKRQLAVIKAEYRKWRRNYKSKATGCLIYDTRSEFDFLECSPLNDRSLMLTEDWTSDTLFSAINGPFPFPDPREIARGAGIADFIQPSLGPLQPNLEDIDHTFAELLQSSRLPPVPEEGTDDIIRNVDYGFSAIMGPEQMDSSNIMNVPSTSANHLQTSDDANMLDLNTPISTMQFSDIERQFVQARDNSSLTVGNQPPSNMLANDDSIMAEQRTSGVLLSDGVTAAALNRPQTKHFGTSADGGLTRQACNEFPSKSVIKGRVSKNFQRSFRREPHNYDKAQPTMHQTTIYQLMLAEQQKTQQQTLHQHLQPSLSTSVLQHQTNTYQQQQPSPQQPQQQPQTQLQFTSSPYAQPNSQSLLGSAGNGNNFVFSDAIAPATAAATITEAATIDSNLLGIHGASQQSSKQGGFGLLQTVTNVPNNSQTAQAGTAVVVPNTMMNVKVEPHTASDMLSIFNLPASNSYCNNGSAINASFKPYPNPNVSIFKKSASTGTFIMRTSDINAQQQQQPQNYLQQDPATQTHTVTQMSTQNLALNLIGQLPSFASSIQRQTNVQNRLSPSSSQQQQQHHLVEQQTQQQQQQQVGVIPKEMFRSNSLPLNVSLHKLDTRFGHDNNFAVPKYHSKSTKTRTRSNSIHQHAVAPNGGNNGVSNLLVSQQLQAATSDPMLNSTLAQLLTTNTRIPPLGKHQSSSTSAISSINAQMSPGPIIPTATAMSLAKPQHSAPSSLFVAAAVQGTSQSVGNLMGPLVSTAAISSVHQQQQQMLQQHKSPKKSSSLPASAPPLMIHSPPGTIIMGFPPAASQTTPNAVQHLSLSPESFHEQDSPLSPTHSLKYPRDNQRRAGHIHAEQKRRCNIKNGFDMLHSLIPQLQQNPNAKLSKAAMLQKGADHINHLRNERNILKDKMETLRLERDSLNNSLTHLHSILPANGALAPVTRQGTEHVRQLYEQYVRYRTMNNWKFWILGLILEPLLSSYTVSVSSANMEELRRTAFLWIDQHCSLIDLRPAVSNKLKYLSMKTDILSDPPSTLQEEVAKAINHTIGQHPNLHGT